MAADAIPTGFTGLLITTRIVTDIYHLLAHQTRHAEPSGSERNRYGIEADHGDDPPDNNILPFLYADLWDTRARADDYDVYGDEKNDRKTARQTRRASGA